MQSEAGRARGGSLEVGAHRRLDVTEEANEGEEEASYGWFNVGTDGAGVRADWLATYRARAASVLVGSNSLYNRCLSFSRVVAATGSPVAGHRHPLHL